ncbi:alpha-amylase family glycosyl hydrolase [Christiangramia flava]|uniref:1,4-alpha-glucan branching enzyme n=1 Tax=Christiangramia flava JLT2011 TaxID=1229726 RepID=A0A1L7HZZ1_9FLAO|nr:alpha-amylase family glycosyl hydrolase [Christiangramia flava]APU66916.1 1,4-alpha-glucan branching enzyme [Christiangramia flava JLT2011]OSS38015.1 1,4-alpha-glucan branching enzyme [Christiangramia flava JLT2011]
MKKLLLLLLTSSILTVSCKNEHKDAKEETNEMAKDSLAPVSDEVMESAVIYEVNIRQYSPEGTFNAFTKDIPQLKDLGVKVVWLMPMYPIAMKNRKATGEKSIEDITDTIERKKYLGSYYSISDYSAVNPNFGTMEDFDKLVETAHENGMYVILDWVANHTGWDHAWITEHPEYYTKDKNGEITDPINDATGEPWGWTDVADLNFDNEGLREAMKQEMLFWVKEHNIDGYRADAAHSVPTDFWEDVSADLREVKPVFMLAEAESPKDLFHNAFEMGYNWEGHHIMNEIAQGKKTAKDWDEYMKKIDTTFEDDDYLMNFITNHDENSWAGTVKERMGDASEAMLAMSYTIPGMPLVYSGQEYDMDKRLRFFEKDTIPHQKGKVYPILEKLGKLKNENAALHGAKQAASYETLETSNQEKILAYERKGGGSELIYLANMSDQPVKFTVSIAGDYQDYMANSEFQIEEGQEMEFQPWEYKILTKN